MIDWAEWGPPLAVMLAAGLGGGALAFTLRRDESEAGEIEDEGRKADLEGRHAEALEALAALETQKDAMDPADYAAERRALLDKGANAMRKLDEEAGIEPAGASGDALSKGIAELTAALKRGEIDEITYAKAVAALSDQANVPASPPEPKAARPIDPPPVAPAGSAPAKAPAISPAWQGAIYTIAGLAVVGGLFYAANNQTVPRRDGASMTGNQDLGAAETPPAGQNPQGEPPWMAQQRQAALAALEKDPKDVKALNTLTQLALSEPAKAWNYNEQAREADPDDIDAKMLNGVITAIMGMPDKSQEKFDEILAENPDHAATWAWKGLTYAEMKEWDKTVEALEKAKSLGVSDHTIDNTLAMAKNGGKRPDGGPMMGGPAPQPGATPPNTATIASGIITLDDNRKTFKATTLFVNIKDPANPGPPIAAKKLPPGPYPMAFSITEADKIGMGGPMGNRPIPDTVQLSVRLDEDGNAFTKKPTDPQVVLEVTRGTKGLELTLK